MFFEVSHVKIENLELDAAVTWSTARDYKHSNNDYDVLVESHAINIQGTSYVPFGTYDLQR